MQITIGSLEGLPPGTYDCEIKSVSERRDARGEVLMLTLDFAPLVVGMLKMQEAAQQALGSWVRSLGSLGRALAVCSPVPSEAWVHAWVRAHCAEWLTLYLQAKGPVSTNRIKGAYRNKRLNKGLDFNALRALASKMGFLEGTTWRLPAEHPLA